jgi:hypothetical protein
METGNKNSKDENGGRFSSPSNAKKTKEEEENKIVQ